MTPRRFVLGPDAIEGNRVRFDAAEAHHLARVLRLRAGALVEAADGGGRVYTIRLEAVDAREARGVIVEEAAVTRESPCAITLAQAILKGERMTWLVQKATELGVARIVPLETARSVARAAGPEGRRRWERVAREAVKQCGRAVVPAIDAPRPFGEALVEAGGPDPVWLLWQGGGTPVAALARAAGRPRRLWLFVGPEGGFSDDEVARAKGAGALLAALGPRILRAESAGLAALALCQHHFGDLGAEDP